MTNRLVDHLEDRVLKRWLTEIAQDCGVSDSTLRNVRDELVSDIENGWVVRTPRLLGIDDVKIQGTARTVFIDSETGEILFLADSKEGEDVIPALNLFFAGGPPEVVTCDMDIAYLPMIRKHLPHSRIVFDKFHVAQRANKMMREVRRAWQRSKTDGSALLHPMEKKAYDYRRHNLPKRKDDFLNRTWLPDIRLLEEAYNLKEGFLQILDLKSQQEAEVAFEHWTNEVTEWLGGAQVAACETETQTEITKALLGLINLVSDNLDETFGGLSDGLSNARTENANGRIRAIEGVGRDFSYGVLKDRILYGHLKPSTDLYQCDICGKRSVNQPERGLDIGGSWSSHDPSLCVRQQFCDPCWDTFTDARADESEEGIPVDEQLPPRPTRPAIRDRIRARDRARLEEKLAAVSASANARKGRYHVAPERKPTKTIASEGRCAGPNHYSATAPCKGSKSKRKTSLRGQGAEPRLPHVFPDEPEIN